MKNNAIFSLFVIGISLFFCFPTHIFSQESGVLPSETVETNPKNRSVKVTASVRDHTAPSVPILIAPENGSIATTQTPTFVWEKSTDDQGIQKYQLFLDGTLRIDNISPGPADTATHTTTLDDEEISLLIKQAIPDGTHTWKIVAYDNNGNSAASATWQFLIDTAAPTIFITSIDGETVSITSQDATTIPAEPMRISQSEPEIKGQSEPGATVTLTIQSPDELETLSTTADAAGLFSFTLPFLSSGVETPLQFVATDAAGHTTVLDGIVLLLPEEEIIILPSPYSGVIPIPPIKPPGQVIKETRKAIEKTVGNIIDKAVPSAASKEVKKIMNDTVLPVSNTFLGLMLPAAKIAIASSLSGIPLATVTPSYLVSLFQALSFTPKTFFLFLLPYRKKRRHGVVFDIDTVTPLPYAVISVFQLDKDREKEKHLSYADLLSNATLFDTVVTNHKGEYGEISLPVSGEYVLGISHKNHHFEAEKAKLRYTENTQIYTGEKISFHSCSDDPHSGLLCINEDLQLAYLIPLVRKEDQTKNVDHGKAKYWYAHTSTLAIGGCTAILDAFAVVYPSPWNIGVALIYSLVLLRRLFGY